jgi:fructose-specific component phosphotransferase system IIB-like protein
MGSAAPANDTQYAQAQKAIAALQPEDQKQILAVLQSDPKVKSAMTTKPAQPKAKAPAATPAASAQPSADAPQQPAVSKQTPAADPAQQTATQSSAEPTKQKTKGRKKAAAPSQAEIDADRERIIGPTSDSIIRTGRSIVEHIDEAGLMAKLGTKVGQAAQATGAAAGKAVGTVQQAVADPEHSKALVKAFAKGDTSADPNSAPPIQDSSGTVPKPIVDKINQLNLEQRAELHKLITQKTL